MGKNDSAEQEKNGAAEDTKEQPRIQSPLGRWLRRSVMILLIFVMLVLVAWFTLIGPNQAKMASFEAQLLDAQQQNSILETQVAELQSYRAQRSIWSLMADANAARFQIARGDLEAAAATLADGDKTIFQLDLDLQKIGATDQEAISTLTTRLSLAREGIQAENEISSLADLDVFINTLQILLQSIMSQ